MATAEVEILELLQKNDENGVANVVHMKEHFHFRNHMCITFDLMGWVFRINACPLIWKLDNKQDVCN